jgi:ribosome maturation factor RimP
MDAKAIADRVGEIVERIAQERDLELVQVEFVSGTRKDMVLRVFIDKPGGVTHEDCTAISLHLGTLLDVEDFIQPAYTLEVSSPGLERGLYKLADYQRFAGSLAKLKTDTPLGGQRNFRGRIAGVTAERVLFQDRTRGLVEIPFAVIAKANLEIDFQEELRRAREKESK